MHTPVDSRDGPVDSRDGQVALQSTEEIFGIPKKHLLVDIDDVLGVYLQESKALFDAAVADYRSVQRDDVAALGSSSSLVNQASNRQNELKLPILQSLEDRLAEFKLRLLKHQQLVKVRENFRIREFNKSSTLVSVKLQISQYVSLLESKILLGKQQLRLAQQLDQRNFDLDMITNYSIRLSKYTKESHDSIKRPHEPPIPQEHHMRMSLLYQQLNPNIAKRVLVSNNNQINNNELSEHQQKTINHTNALKSFMQIAQQSLIGNNNGSNNNGSNISNENNDNHNTNNNEDIFNLNNSNYLYGFNNDLDYDYDNNNNDDNDNDNDNDNDDDEYIDIYGPSSGLYGGINIIDDDDEEDDGNDNVNDEIDGNVNVEENKDNININIDDDSDSDDDDDDL